MWDILSRRLTILQQPPQTVAALIHDVEDSPRLYRPTYQENGQTCQRVYRGSAIHLAGFTIIQFL